ncbi:YfhO family protein [Miniphocaeibacter halophilus]|uniref:YfhO family protein n=1 Tax=Miniphocaeibacter halophilus TaxID=2931922 RepID=A0AC61MNU6_9FIRM|nr:YfhO family protein [Miniphocaeibacter halophilus]QQK07165.1 YfhO family protein [Miniphocaeibacter halophilus]
MIEKLKRLENKKNYFHILSFVIPIIIFLIIFIVSRFYPFGNNQILVIDAYHQYYHFMLELRGKILKGESIFFSWHLGLGTDFISLMAYYCTSPLNLLTILVPESMLSIFFALLIAIKVGIAAVTFSVYLKSIYQQEDYSLVIFSLLYSLCGFIAGYYWNIMWIDVFALFPLVILGLKNIIIKNKFKIYIISIALCFFTNYYMSIFVSIFAVIFYVFYSINVGVRFLDFIKRGFKILGASILAAGLFSWILIPAAITLTNVFKTASPFMGDIETYHSFTDILSNFLAFNFPTVREGLPNIYSGLITIFLSISYFLSRRIKIKEKILSLIVIVFLILSTNINILNYIWHGFRYTNMLPYRFTFILSFVLVVIAYKGYKNLKYFEKREYISISLIALGVVIFLGSNRTVEVLIANVVVLLIYLLLIYSNRIKYRVVVSFLLYFLIIAEVFANTYIGVSTAGKTDHGIFNANKEEIDYFVDKVEKEKGNDFYRMEILDRFTYNDPALYQYNGVALFSSTIDARVSTFLEKIGIPSYPIGNRYFYSYGSPLTNGILNIDYLISREKELYENFDIDLLESKNNVFLYKNNKSLPLGFMIKEEALFENYYSTLLENQNTIFKSFTGLDENIFTLIEKNKATSSGINLEQHSNGNYDYTILADNTEGEINIEYIIPESGYYYVDTDKVEDEKIIAESNREKITLDARRKSVMSVGYFEKGETVNFIVKIKSEDDGDYGLKLALLDENVFNEGYKILKEESASSVKYSSRKVNMKITALNKGYLFTSIPYNEGWTAYVDGNKTEIKPFKDAFVGLNLDRGEHIIEFKYTPVGFKEGVAISIFSLIVFVFIIKRENEKEMFIIE